MYMTTKEATGEQGPAVAGTDSVPTFSLSVSSGWGRRPSVPLRGRGRGPGPRQEARAPAFRLD